MFSAKVYDGGLVHISGKKNITDVMMSVTMICHSIYDCDKLSKRDRDVFKAFVQEELGRIAFADEDAMKAEEERLRKSTEKKSEELEELKKEIADQLAEILLDIFKDEDGNDDDRKSEDKA